MVEAWVNAAEARRRAAESVAMVIASQKVLEERTGAPFAATPSLEQRFYRRRAFKTASAAGISTAAPTTLDLPSRRRDQRPVCTASPRSHRPEGRNRGAANGAARANLMLGLFAQLNAVRRQTTVLARLNLELAELESKQKATAVGIAGGLAAGAAALVFYAIGFSLAAAAAGLAEALPVWLSLIIVVLVALLVAAILGFLSRRTARRASPLQPAQAIDEAQRTLKALEGNV
jgi:hypothetical protein